MLRQGFHAEGGVNLLGATIGADLVCENGRFVGKGKMRALNANGAKIEGSVLFDTGFGAEGEVNLGGATIGEDLVCGGGRFAGGVNLVGATIGGNLDCDSGQFVSNSEAPALVANGAKIEGGVFLGKDFKADGGVAFVAAKIGMSLQCDAGEFISKSEIPALNADSAKIEGSVFFRYARAEGEVRFADAYVGGNFQWRIVQSPKTAILNLYSAKVGTLFVDRDSWPKDRNLFIRDFVYDQIDDEASPNAAVQLGWLHLQPRELFSSQPYEHLADILRKRGLEDDAQKVMIEKNKDYAARLHWRRAWLWYGLVGKLIGYGYRPWRAFWISVIVIGIGYFEIADENRWRMKRFSAGSVMEKRVVHHLR